MSLPSLDRRKLKSRISSAAFCLWFFHCASASACISEECADYNYPIGLQTPNGPVPRYFWQIENQLPEHSCVYSRPCQPRLLKWNYPAIELAFFNDTVFCSEIDKTQIRAAIRSQHEAPILNTICLALSVIVLVILLKVLKRV